jgi:hypothetical protein
MAKVKQKVDELEISLNKEKEAYSKLKIAINELTKQRTFLKNKAKVVSLSEYKKIVVEFLEKTKIIEKTVEKLILLESEYEKAKRNQKS